MQVRLATDLLRLSVPFQGGGVWTFVFKASPGQPQLAGWSGTREEFNSKQPWNAYNDKSTEQYFIEFMGEHGKQVGWTGTYPLRFPAKQTSTEQEQASSDKQKTPAEQNRAHSKTYCGRTGIDNNKCVRAAQRCDKYGSDQWETRKYLHCIDVLQVCDEKSSTADNTRNPKESQMYQCQQREEAEQQREEAEQQREKAKQQREEAEQQREEAEQQREEAELELKRRTQNTTLLEFLDACHRHLFLGLDVQEDKETSTKGDPANAEQKLRPDYIREWNNFPSEQAEIWKALMDADFVAERHFTPLLVLEDNGKDLRQRSLSSELDLGYFERQTVEMRVASVIKQLHKNTSLRETFQLKGDVAFENHANTLTDDRILVKDMSSLSLNTAPLRRSRRLAAKSEGTAPLSAATRQESHQKQQRPARPKADQFCVYNKGSYERIPAFVVEYKAPHKLSLSHIKAGLMDMNLDNIVRIQENETSEIICRRVIAAVITQAYSYMASGGIEFGYVCTGEAFIYLHIKCDEPECVYYYLSVPKEDVGESTGWAAGLYSDNRLHLTALGQVLAFTLRALQNTPRDISWIKWAEAKLNRWEIVYDDILGEIEEKDIPDSDFKPSARSRDKYLRMSPVKTRARAVLASATSCDPSQHIIPSDDDENSDEGFDPNTPSRSPREPRAANSSRRRAANSSRRQAASEASKDTSTRGIVREYCTQHCLQGLKIQAPLDPTCPNASTHGVDRHRLGPAAVIRRLSKQFSPQDLHLDTQLGCQSLHTHGARGALFKVTLLSHGYTFVGKGVPAEFVAYLKHEESIYAHLAEIQGTHVPTVLGGLDVPSFSYDGIVQIVRILLMGHAGAPIARAIKQWPGHRDRLIRKAEMSLRAVQRYGVLHSDPIPNNILRNDASDQVMLIDFERAAIPKQRKRLMPISSNRKRKRVDQSAKSEQDSVAFDREIRELRNNLF
ncbi:Protein kinase-like domain protein [Metarhizium rileyi]|uniref:Protein kinase-like domain protein n=1 Tax=Metarhizium rileyi (strain RCEF 4871) TaxID=1649241 RepID=A0A167DC14_METRR|nr:Protein kinase-like domain protein [Metarhizium rileyi RCEF 4871]